MSCSLLKDEGYKNDSYSNNFFSSPEVYYGGFGDCGRPFGYDKMTADKPLEWNQNVAGDYLQQG